MENILSDVSKINTGDGLLVSGTTFLSKTIQSFEKLKWSHAGLFLWDNDVLFVAEMVAKGLVLTDFKEYLKSNKDLLICKPDFIVTNEQVNDFVLPKLGHTRYGFFNLFIAQPIKFLTNYRIWLGSNDDTPNTFICGEFFECFFNNLNSDLFPNWKRDSPLDIFNNKHFTHSLFKKQP